MIGESSKVGQRSMKMSLTMSNRLKYASALVSVALVAVGCLGAPPDPTASPGATVPDAKINFVSDAGVPVTQSTDPLFMHKVVVASKFGPAPQDPFKLKPYEVSYDTEQTTDRVFSSIGGYRDEFTPPNPADEAPPRVVEPQPYRRLSGVVVGDSILALIDMGNGQSYLIRPGMTIPNSEWRVVSIDMDKAVLERDGDTLPKEIVVRLELPPPGMSGGVGAGFNPGGGIPGAGAPRGNRPGLGVGGGGGGGNNGAG
jgi:hypothetical protein